MLKVYMDDIITVAPHQGGWFVFSSHQEIRTTDERTGEDRISYVADAEWVNTLPLQEGGRDA